MGRWVGDRLADIKGSHCKGAKKKQSKIGATTSALAFYFISHKP